MCGIAGIYDFHHKSIDRRIPLRMSRSLAHRGPDGSGLYLGDHICLVHRRLAIIDPRSSGNQPLSVLNGRYSIVFNGEIFNYRELRKLLIRKGYQFKTETDTEILATGYHEWKEGVVKKLIGQFAFCIFDRMHNSLFLARDHAGIIPLYYAHINSRFIFGSEIKSIIASGLVSRQIDTEALYHFASMFTFPAPLTVFKDIKSLLPGTTIKVLGNTGAVKIMRYWSLPVGTWKDRSWTETEITDELRKRFRIAVERASVSDVPISVFLSGGVDSSAIAAFLSESSMKPIKTYSMWTEGGAAYDERKFTRMVVDRYHTDHTDFSVGEDDLLKELPNIIYHMDQPTGGSLESYFISKLVSRESKVALSGLGGDELFGGYHANISGLKTLSDVYNLIPQGWMRGITSAFKKLPISETSKKRFHTAHMLLDYRNSFDKYLFLYFAYMDNEKKRLFNPAFMSGAAYNTTEEYFGSFRKRVKSLPLLDQLYMTDMNTYTRDDLLLGINMMSMANGLETRVPFLDPDLIRTADSIPPALKQKKGTTKYILKRMLQMHLPAEVMNHKKTGFALPRHLFMKRKLKTYIISTLKSKSFKDRGIFNQSAVDEEVNRFFSDTTNTLLWKEHLRIWILFVFELWCRMYLDRTALERPDCSIEEYLP